MSNRFRFVPFFILLLTHCAFAFAQDPRVISYQGVLTDTNGVAKPNGNYNFTFQLFSSATGGTALWTETKSLALRNGLFATMLGDQTGFPDSVTFDKAYWLNLQVGSEVLVPRIRLGAVGYAFYALRADTAKFAFVSVVGSNSVVTASIQDGAVTTEKLGDNAVTTAKLANDAVNSSKIADGSVTSADVAANFKAPRADTATYAFASVVGNNSVGTGALQDQAITSAKIADGTIQRIDVVSDFKSPKADTADVALAALSASPSGVAGGDLAGNFPNPTIASVSITTTKIADNAVTAAKIEDGAVTSTKIADGAVSDSKIAAMSSSKLTGALPALDGSALTNITASSTSPNSVDSTNIKDASIATADVKDGSITDAKIAEGISASKLTGALPGLDGSALTNISATNLAGGTYANAYAFSNVSNSFIGSGVGLTSLNATNLSSGTIDDARLPSIVTKAGNIFNGADQLVQLSNLGKLPALDGSALTNVTASSLAAGTYANQYSFTSTLNSFVGSFSGDGSGLTGITAATVGDNSVDSTDIKDGSIATNDIRLGAITNEKIADGISASKLTGSLPALDGSALTNISANSLAGGTYSNAYTFSSESNSFAGNGSGLTSLNATSLSSGTVDDARLSSVVTKAGNAFNGADQLVQLTNLGKLPALDGSALTNVSSNALASGTYANQYSFTNIANSFVGSFSGDGSGLTGITAATVGDNSVDSTDIKDGSIATNDIRLGAITNEKIADGISASKLTGSLPALDGSALTNISANSLAGGTYSNAYTFSSESNSFAGNGSGLTSLNATSLSSGTVDDARLSSVVTKAGNAFNGADQLVQLTNLGKLPALDGSALTNVSSSSLAAGTYASQYSFTNALNSFAGSGAGLTSLNATNLSSGTIDDARLSSTVTKAGNTFNGADQLLQLTSLGKLPALDGSALFGLSANELAAGTYSNEYHFENALNSITGNGSGLTNLDPANLSAVVPIAKGGTGSDTVNFVDLTTSQTITVPKVFAPSGVATGLIVRRTTAIAELQPNIFEATDASGSETYFSITANGQLFGDGMGLTNLDASDLAFGTIPDGRLTGVYSSALTLSSESNSFTGNGLGLFGLNASNLSSGAIPDGRLSGVYTNALTLSNTANIIVCTTLAVGGSTLRVGQGKIGVGTDSASSTLEINGSIAVKVRSISSAATAGDEGVLLVDATSAVTLHLPDASSVPGRTYNVKMVAGSSNITIDALGGSIDGAASVIINVLNKYNVFVSDGTNWFIIGGDPLIP